MPTQRSNIIATIDLKAIIANYKFAAMRAANSQVIPVIKADAYGHGAVAVAQALLAIKQAKYKAVERFAVARFCEAQILREQGIKQRILILSEHISDYEAIKLALTQNYELVVHNQQSVNTLLEFFSTASTNTQASSHKLTIWLKVDTGMHRLGLNSAEFIQAYTDLAALNAFENIYLMSHCATADAKSATFLEEQLSQFKQLQQNNSSLSCSFANSAALLRNKKYHMDFVRPGIMLYGADPLFATHLKSKLMTTMQLTAPVIALRTITAGESVGYNRSWYAGRDSTIAIIGIGYADGYPRHARNGTPVAINGQLAPLVGTVSMDMLSVDVTDLEHIKVGDRAELWGPHIDVNQIALCAQTISYALFTGLGPRVERIYSTLNNKN